MVNVPLPFWNLLKKLGRKPERMVWGYCFADRWKATDLTPEEISGMRKSAEWMVEKKMAPCSFYITETGKGTYLIPAISTLPIMKIDCPPQKKVKVWDESKFSLKPGYRYRTNEFEP